MTSRYLGRSLAAFALLTVAFAAAPAHAQVGTLWYKEVVHDERIYVFNDPNVFQAWESSREMGKSITKIGYGPKGETVVFDSENAVDLYNLRHGKDAEVRPYSAPKPPKVYVTWKDGKTTLDGTLGQVNLSNRIQPRFTQTDPAAGPGQGSFRIRRAKTKIDGWFYSKNLTGELQLNWADTANALEDANLNWDILGNKAIQLKLGQYKVPFGRQELTSSGSQQFVDRSIVSNEFAKGRDIGLQVWGLCAAGTIDWRVGVFNGGGRNRTTNDNGKYQWNARVTWSPWGDVKYSEADFESTDRPLLAVAGQLEKNDLHGTTTGNDPDRRIYGGDVSFKYLGISVFGEYFRRRVDPETGASFDSNGFAAQVGYLIGAARKWEVAGRYASWDPTDLVRDNDRNESGFAVSYYEYKHSLKLQADFRQIEDEARRAKDRELRVQLQFIF